jgi:hypothetical protein
MHTIRYINPNFSKTTILHLYYGDCDITELFGMLQYLDSKGWFYTHTHEELNR